MNEKVYQQINLYHPIFRRQRHVFSAAMMLQATGIVATALLTIYVYGLWQVHRLEADALDLEGREKAYSAQLAGLDPGSSADQRQEMERELARLNATILEQQRLIDVLREQPLGSTEGFSAYLAALARRHTRGLWLTEFTINGGARAIELVGRSIDPELVPAYLLTLGEEEALTGQRFDDFKIDRADDEPGIVFRVSSGAATDLDGPDRMVSQ